MRFYVLDPEVAGALGVRSKLDTSVHPPRVLRLHYELDAWLGDDLVQSFPCFLITRRLWREIEKARPSGATVEAAEITVTAESEELNPRRIVPEFLWLKVSGTPGRDDFGMTDEARLVVSEAVFRVMKSASLNNCGVAVFGGADDA